MTTAPVSSREPAPIAPGQPALPAPFFARKRTGSQNARSLRARGVEGMGALALEKGTAFRVWAPHAEGVSVVGTFNDWQTDRNPLAKEGSGHWFGAIPEARAGDEYRLSFTRGTESFLRIDPWARRVTHSNGNGVLWWPEKGAAGPRFRLPSYNELVIYELHVGSFHVHHDKGPGTFASTIEKLPYLRELGVNAIEVMPVAEFAGDSSWGYNPAHPFAVEGAYGGPEGFLKLVRAAHEHGIGVILDVVYNHFGPDDLSLWQFDGWHENDLGGIYFYNDWKAKTPWGDTRPDYGRGEVRSYLHDNALMWMRDFGVDGLRVDMSVYIRTVNGVHGDPGNELADGWSLLQWINHDIASEFPGALTIAEDLHDDEWLVKDTSVGGAGFGSQWDAGFVHPVRATMIVLEDNQRSLDKVIGALAHRYDGDAFKRVIYSESHDEVANGKARLPTEIDAGEAGGYYAKKRSLLGAALTLTAPGIPMLFQGQEFLEDEWFRNEVPVDWSKQERFAGVLTLYRDMIALRRNLAGCTGGLRGASISIHHVDHERKVLGYHRWMKGGPGDDVIVIMNLSHVAVEACAVGAPHPGAWKLRLNSDATVYSDDFTGHPASDVSTLGETADGMAQSLRTGIGPYTVLIFSQDPPKPAE